LVNGLSRPAAARLGYDNPADHPHVRCVITAVAELNARLRLAPQLRRERFVNNLRELAAPRSTAPRPSVQVVQFTPDPSAPDDVVERDAVLVPAGAPPESTAARVSLRACYRTRVRPVSVQSAAAGPGVDDPALPAATAKAGAVVRLTLTTDHPKGFAGLPGFDSLRLFLAGGDADDVPFQLHEAIFGDLAGAWARPDGGEWLPCGVEPVGFGRDEELVPHHPATFRGERLLRDFFAFPQKHLFAELTRLAPAARTPRRVLHIVLAFARPWPELCRRVRAEHFVPNATPAVNLFAEEVCLTARRTRVRCKVTSQARPGAEVYAVLNVKVRDGRGQLVELPPWLPGRVSASGEDGRRWVAERQAGPDGGPSSVFLSILDPNGRPPVEGGEPVWATAEFTSGGLPAAVPQSNWRLARDRRMTATSVTPPTPTLRPPLESVTDWAALTDLTLNALALTGATAAGRVLAGALRSLAALDATPDPDAVPTEAARRQLVTGLLAGLKGVRVTRDEAWVGEPPGGLVPGQRYALEVADAPGRTGSGFLFASVLEAFLGHTATFDSFVRTSVTTPQVTRTWTPRIGNTPVL
jgi:type VI secretion system protein ImpG